MQVEDLARAIAQHAVLDAWPYWLILIVLVFLGVVAGNFLASYAAKRGEVEAARVDREEILAGVRKATKAAEEVRSAVALDEWTKRERRTLRRTKLEELMILAHKTRDWHETEFNRRLYDEASIGSPSPQPIMMTVGSLYFPELHDPLKTFDVACAYYRSRIIEVHQAILHAKATNGGNTPAAEEAANVVRGEKTGYLVEGYKTVFDSLSQLQVSAAHLMATMIAPPSA